jgi:hypothetical protein
VLTKINCFAKSRLLAGLVLVSSDNDFSKNSFQRNRVQNVTNQKDGFCFGVSRERPAS